MKDADTGTQFSCHSTIMNDQSPTNDQSLPSPPRFAAPLPPEEVCNTRASRLPNCAPFCQLATLNDTYKHSFYPRAIRTWNSLPLALIPNSLDEFKVTISSM